MPAVPSRHQRARQRGGRIAVGVFSAILGGLTVLWSTQIMIQAWSHNGTASGDCRESVRQLLSAVRRARQAAAREPGGERAAVGTYRAELNPEWQARPALTQACGGDEDALRLLREVDLLRYAEERSVRSNALDVTRRRQRVLILEAEILGASLPSPPASHLAKP